MSKIKGKKTKLLFAIADRDTEDYLSTVMKEDAPDVEVVGIVTYKEKVIQKVNQLEPDILLLRETLPGTLSIADLLFELRYSYPNVRIIFLAGDRKPGDTFLITLVTYGVYDLLVGGHHKISDVIELINIPNTFKDINYLIPKAALNEVTNSMTFDSPIVVETNKKNIVVIEENPRTNRAITDSIDLRDSEMGKRSETHRKHGKGNNLDNSLRISSNIKQDEVIKEDDYFDFDFSFEEDNPNQLDTSFIEENDTLQFNKNISKQEDVLNQLFEQDSESNDINIEFNFEDDANSGYDNFDFSFEEEITKSNFNSQDNIIFDDDYNVNSIQENDEDFLIDIDLDNLKDNKDRNVDNILMEEECEDLLFDNIDNIQDEYKIKESSKAKDNISNNAYYQNNKDNKLNYQESNNEHLTTEEYNDNYSLEDLTKEIESLREENEKGLNIIEEEYYNDLRYEEENNEDFSNEYYDEDFNNQYYDGDNSNNQYYNENNFTNNYEQEFKNREIDKKEKHFKPIFSKHANNTKVVVSRQKIISFIGGKNGVGTSSMAINTAVKLAQSGHKVIYMELNTIHPTIGYWYQIGHLNQGIETAVKSVEKGRLEDINKSIIKTCVLKKQNKKLYRKIPDNLDFLLFSKQETILKDKNKPFNPNALKDLFLKLTIDMGYDFIILDLDFDLNNMYTTTSLNFSNLIYSVITQDTSALAYLLFKIEELEKKGCKIKNKSKYIVNRYEGNGSQITLKEIKEWLDSKEVYTMPDVNKDFINANALSIPLVSYTKDEKAQKCFDDITLNI